MTRNPFLSLIVGFILLAVVCGIGWGMLIGLEALASTPADRHGREMIALVLSLPLIGFVAYLVGDAVLAIRGSIEPRTTPKRN